MSPTPITGSRTGLKFIYTSDKDSFIDAKLQCEAWGTELAIFNTENQFLDLRDAVGYSGKLGFHILGKYILARVL